MMTQEEFTEMALRKVPVAEAVLGVLAKLLSPEAMERVYELHRGRCYQKVLSFQGIVELVMSAILVHQGSGRQAFRQARSSEKMPTTDQAAYNKIARMPAAVSQGLLDELVPSILALLPESVTTDVPASFQAFHVFGVDGKKIKDVAKRLSATRGTPGKLLGGKTLVALSVHEGIVTAMSSHLDGEANDGPLVPALLESLQKRCPEPSILLLDSQFCDLTTPNRILAKDWEFVIRYHPKTHFHADAAAGVRTGTDPRDRDWREEIGWLGKPGGRNSIRVRRITVMREEKPDLIIVTSLLDGKTYSANDVLALYGLRWTIETVFQHVTQEFDLRTLIGSTPEATIFQFTLSLLLYNIAVLIQQHASEKQNLEPSEVSMPKIIRETRKQLAALGTFLSVRTLDDAIQAKGTSHQRITKLLKACWCDDWKKAIKNYRNFKAPPPKQSGAHTSAYRRIQQFKAH